MGIILLLPLTYTLPKSTLLVMLCGIFCGSMFGGSVSAILLRTLSATATLLDGYPPSHRADFIILSVAMIGWAPIENIRKQKEQKA